MPLVAGNLRDRLHAIWKKVVDGDLDKHLLNDNAVPRAFLNKWHISLKQLDFEASDDHEKNLVLNLPLLFQPRPPAEIKRYPIDLVACGRGDLFNIENLKFREYKPSENIEDIYQSDWSPGGISGPHPIDDGKTPGYDGYYEIENRWQTHIYEYNIKDRAGRLLDFSHTILVAEQSSFGHEGTIMLGELTALITTMHKRSRQPKTWVQKDEDEDDYDDTESENDVVANGSDLVHRHERRFPVRLWPICLDLCSRVNSVRYTTLGADGFFFIGPQGARIYYACMSGLDIKIYQSRMYRLQKRDDNLFDLFAGILLSKPLSKKDQVKKR
ncbi:hypothetical protein BDW74DRAFT_178548 [Aspergillus multicolor]|uniref:uncharacterized protein n=1 Tax=Aspergillus multicolor TaxID=41759 RepID=UPI003CCDB946